MTNREATTTHRVGRSNAARVSSVAEGVSADVLEMAAAVETMAFDESALGYIVEPLRAAFAMRSSIAYRVAATPDYSELESFHTHGIARWDDMLRDFGAEVRNARPRWGLFDPRHPEADQRNVAVATNIATTTTALPRMAIIMQNHIGSSDLWQLRVLVCDGPVFLGWVGGFRDGAFVDADRTRMEALVPALARRISLEQRVLQGRVDRAALDALLTHVPGRALVLDATGGVAFANGPARAWLDGDIDARDVVREAAGSHGASGPFDVTSLEVRGVRRHLLLVESGTGRAQSKVDDLAKKSRLTRRQRDVFRLVVRGYANKEVAQSLGISVATVEAHLTAVFRAVHVESRAQLVALACT